jgi:acetoin utilization deacetylase AcuC-like enzyme
MDVSLQSEIKDKEYLQILNSTLKTIQKKIIPDIVLYDAGVDVFADDKLGNLKLSLEGIKKRDHLVLDHFRKLDIPVATVIGGYSKDIQELANRHSIIFETALNFLKK